MAELIHYTPNIMIVTIDPEITNVIEVLLSNLNYKIRLTNNSSDAIEKLKEKDFDLMLLDAALPGMNILQFVNYVRKNSPHTFIIILAGISSNEKVTECLNQGAYDLLRKPFEKEEVIKRVKNALEQKRLKKELSRVLDKLVVSGKRYQHLIQNSPDFVYTLDSEGRFTFINESSKHLLGYDNNDLLKKHYSSIIYPDDLEKAKHFFHERRKNSRGVNAPKVRLMTSREGARQVGVSHPYIIVELKAKGLYSKSEKCDGKGFLGTHGIARDISKHLQAEEALKLQKIYFSRLFNNSLEAIAIVDTNDKIIDINKSFTKLFMYTADELRHQYISSLIMPKKLKNDEISLTQIAISNGSIETESVRLKKDKSEVSVSVYVYPIKYKSKPIAAYHIYRDLAEIKRSEKELENTLARLRKAMGGIINAMVSTVEVRDPYTAGHQQRVADLARAIAQEMGLSEDQTDGIRMAGTLHDLGKVNIPAEILSKPGKLSDIEFSLIKTHPKVAYEILKEIDFPWPIADIVHQHHERIDGSGYPLGLSNDEILLEGKILTVADVVEAIASHRPYRPSLGIRRAINEISTKRGIHYDPDVVDACIKLFKEKKFDFTSEITDRHEGFSAHCSASIDN